MKPTHCQEKFNNRKINMYPQLDNEIQIKLDEINEIKDYFIAEISKRKIMSKTLSKYIAAFDYVDKALLVLSTASGSISIDSIATVIGIPVGQAQALF